MDLSIFRSSVTPLEAALVGVVVRNVRSSGGVAGGLRVTRPADTPEVIVSRRDGP